MPGLLIPTVYTTIFMFCCFLIHPFIYVSYNFIIIIPLLLPLLLLLLLLHTTTTTTTIIITTSSSTTTITTTTTTTDVREQAAWALGNVAGDSVQCRDLGKSYLLSLYVWWLYVKMWWLMWYNICCDLVLNLNALPALLAVSQVSLHLPYWLT